MNEKFGNGYALLIGVGQSAYPKWSLPVTVKDVQALRAILTDSALCGYLDDDAHIRLLHDSDATQQAILDGLAWLAAQAAADPDATVMVFYSGHGWLDNSSGRYYLLPHDVEPFDLTASALLATMFTDALRRVQARRLLVFVDSCHAAGMATAKDADAFKLPTGFSQTALPKGLLEELKQGAGRAVFTSSLGKQRSWVRLDGTLSLYTFHLIEALQGAGNQPGDTTVRVSNLMTHLGKSVPSSARAMGKEQTPFFDTATEDFAVALVQGGKGLPKGGWEAMAEAMAQRNERPVQASGERSVATGSDVSNSMIVTGDRNVVQRGKYNIQMGNVQGAVFGDNVQVEQRFSSMSTGGGDFVGRDQSVHGDSVKGDKTGGDKITTGGISDSVVAAGRSAQLTTTTGLSGQELADLFAPLVQAISKAPPEQQEKAMQFQEELKQEVAKGEKANDSRMAKLLDGILALAPGAVSAAVGVFATPVLSGLAGPVTKYVLDRVKG